MSDRLAIILSVPTSGGGATPAATMPFFTVGYRPPRQGRSVSRDVVHNQNGLFIYPYDNGPGLREWDQFQIEVNDSFTNELGANGQEQYERLQFLWNYQGIMGLADPIGVYSVGWAPAPWEPQFKRYPGSAGDKIYDLRVVVNLEER